MFGALLLMSSSSNRSVTRETQIEVQNSTQKSYKNEITVRGKQSGRKNYSRHNSGAVRQHLEENTLEIKLQC